MALKLLSLILTPLLLISNISAQQLDPPEIKCLSVLPNGNIQITWQQVQNTGGQFSSYVLYDAFGNQLTTQSNIAVTTHVHAGANANLASRSFYMQTRANNTALSSVFSDTVSTIFLTVNNPGNGTAWLTWNPIHVPNLPLMSDWYHIYREYPAGVWTLIDSTPYGTEQYFDTISICNAQINYKISVASSGCTSDSNVDGGVFTDIIAPYAPIMSSVSVDTGTGNVTVNWEASESLDAEAYIILHYDPVMGWQPIDTVWGWGNTTYYHNAAGADGAEQAYGIAAFDSCWTNGSPNTSAMGDPHTTMFLERNPLICDNGVHLDWSDYLLWPAGVQNYEVYARIDGGVAQLMGTTPTSELELVGLNPNSTYCFAVRANSNSGESSWSNQLCHTVYQPTPPSMGYITMVTVTGSGVRLEYLGDVAASLEAIEIGRSTDSWGPYNPIAVTAVTGPITTYVDQTADTDSKSYYYQVTALDSCGNSSVLSNVSRTIHLRVSKDEFLHKNTLTWNHYEGWDGQIQEYRIYRSLNGAYDLTPIAVLSPSAIVLEDDVSDLLETSGQFCYYVEAIENLNSYGIQESSRSNEACVGMEPLVWVPNAFTPTGPNPVFKPVMGYVSPDQFRMIIFDRWGQQIFETEDVSLGWDGKINGGDAPMGVYVYQITYVSSAGDFYKKRGSVTLIR